jgi:hypothetical protein
VHFVGLFFSSSLKMLGPKDKQKKCVFVALDIQCEMSMGHIAICGVSDSTIFFHIIS